MKIKLSKRDETPKIPLPPIKDLKPLQRAFSIISEDLVNGLIKQIIMTPFGKQVRWIDPETKKQVKINPQSFQLGYKSKLKVNKKINSKLSKRDK